MRTLAVIVLVFVIALLSYQIFSFWKKSNEAERVLKASKLELQEVERDVNKLRADLEYFGNPKNFEKELRARFNYRAPGEKLIIIVPNSNSTGTQ